MKTSLDGKIFIMSLEGISLQLYLDSVNVRTIGPGLTRSEYPDINTWPWSKTITMQEAMDKFSVSLKKYEDAVNKTLKVAVNQNQFDALVSICYNIGTGGMANSTFIKRINSKSPDSQIKSAMMAWVKAGGKTLQGLVNRRTKEVNLYLYGYYGNGTVNLFPVNPITHKPQYAKGKQIDVKKYLTGAGPIVKKESEEIINPPQIKQEEKIDKTLDDLLKSKEKENNQHTGWGFLIDLIKSFFGTKK